MPPAFTSPASAGEKDNANTINPITADLINPFITLLSPKVDLDVSPNIIKKLDDNIYQVWLRFAKKNSYVIQNKRVANSNCIQLDPDNNIGPAGISSRALVVLYNI
jgi:hypothetical protein